MQLYLCEKPSQAKDIAKVLGINQRAQGFITGGDITITWAIGHLLETASPDVYHERYGQPWRIEVLPIIPEQWQMVIKQETADQFQVINRLLKNADEVIIATDADREGEVIARELLEYCHYQGNVRRLWLSALDEHSVKDALANILPGEKTVKLYYAGKGRSQADWLIGMNLTRLYTLKAATQGITEVLSIGRVQTPTLAMVVNRDHHIETFTPKPWWQVTAYLKKDNVDFAVIWQPAEQYCDEEQRCIQPDVAKSTQQLIAQTSLATVSDVTTKREKISAPLCFDLGTLQQTCSRLWGMGANQVLSIAQTLYEKYKATTYPRTDCGYLPTAMLKEVPQVFSALAKADPALASILITLDKQFISRVWNDKKITAHHAIIPTRQTFDITRLDQDELRVYQLIRQHYMGQFLPVHEVDVTQAVFDVGGQLFKTKGTVNIVTGWKHLFQQTTEEDNETKMMALPTLIKGEQCPIAHSQITDKQTQPPAPFTEGTLIAAMKNAAIFVEDAQLKKILRENAGLGTEATRANILETLFKRHYLRKKGKYLYATAIAKELIAALPNTLTSPGMTALWEQALDDIAQGTLSLSDFMQKQAQWTGYLVEQGQQQPLTMTAPVNPACPVCGSPTRQTKGKSGTFWGCTRYPECQGIIGQKKRYKRSSSRQRYQ